MDLRRIRSNHPIIFACPRRDILDTADLREYATLQLPSLASRQIETFLTFLCATPRHRPALAITEDGPWLVDLESALVRVLALAPLESLGALTYELRRALPLETLELIEILTRMRFLALRAEALGQTLALLRPDRPAGAIAPIDQGFPESAPGEDPPASAALILREPGSAPCFFVCPRSVVVLETRFLRESNSLHPQFLRDSQIADLIAVLDDDLAGWTSRALALSEDGPWLVMVPDRALASLLACRDTAPLTARALTRCPSLIERGAYPGLKAFFDRLVDLAQTAYARRDALVAITQTRPEGAVDPVSVGFPPLALSMLPAPSVDPLPESSAVVCERTRFVLAPRGGVGELSGAAWTDKAGANVRFLDGPRLCELLASASDLRCDLEALELEDGSLIVPIPHRHTEAIASLPTTDIKRWRKDFWTALQARGLLVRESLIHPGLHRLRDLAREAVQRGRPLLFQARALDASIPRRPAEGSELSAAVAAAPFSGEAPTGASPAPIAELARCLETHPDWEARLAAASQLAQLGDRARGAAPSLMRSLRDPDGRVRRWAAYALGEIGDARAGPALSLAFWDEDPEVARAIELAQAKLREGARPPG